MSKHALIIQEFTLNYTCYTNKYVTIIIDKECYDIQMTFGALYSNVN